MLLTWALFFSLSSSLAFLSSLSFLLFSISSFFFLITDVSSSSSSEVEGESPSKSSTSTDESLGLELPLVFLPRARTLLGLPWLGLQSSSLPACAPASVGEAGAASTRSTARACRGVREGRGRGR